VAPRLLGEAIQLQVGDAFAKPAIALDHVPHQILAAVVRPVAQLEVELNGGHGRSFRVVAHGPKRSRFGEGIANLKLDSFPEEGAAPQTAAEIAAAYDREVLPAFEKVKSLTPEQLATPVNFMNFATLPVVIYIGWWANHMIHHRGQLSTYLRAMNAHVPSIYGGSADEPFGMAATA